ncbi:hypothetical protein RugamoR64_58290 [Duganella rhizosphaerae]
MAHALREITFGSLDQHVVVVRHLAKGVDQEMKAPAYAFHFFQPYQAVHAIAKDILTSVAAASDVIQRTGKFESEWADHLRNVAGAPWRGADKTQRSPQPGLIFYE